MRDFWTNCRALRAGVGAALVAGVVFLLGVWTGREFDKPETAARGAAVEREIPLPPLPGKAPAQAQTRNVSRGGGGALAEPGARPLPENAWETAPVAPALNMRKTAEGYEISVSLTGVHPNDLRIYPHAERSLLVIQADLKHPDTGKTATTEGRLRIPRDARIEALVATYEDGRLFISIPR